MRASIVLSAVAFSIGTVVHAATFVVINTLSTGPGSLEQAVVDANANPGLDTIAFNIPPNDGTVKTISQTNTLVGITSPVVIDGYTQPGASSNTLATGDNAVLLVEFTTPNNSQGIGFQVNGCTVRGLVINGFLQGVSFQAAARTNRVEGCFIGTDPTGTNASPHATSVGIIAQSANNTIGGTNPWQRNIIANCSVQGIYVVNLGASSNVIIGNYIGTDRTGTKAIPNQYGIQCDAPFTQIGGTAAGSRNVVSGNSQSGIFVNAATNVVEGNYIGVDVTGMTAVPNGVFGVRLANIGARIGGINAASRNIISGNGSNGVNLGVSTANRNLIQGNLIGTDITGAGNLGNSVDGIRLSAPINNTTIGGGAGNIIAFNGGNAVSIMGGAGSSNNLITANSIFSNGGLGIDLANISTLNGVSTNDNCDADTGSPNFAQNFPVLTNVSVDLTGVTFRGYLPSAASTTYALHFYANTKCDSSGFGEGEIFLGSTNVTTAANCTNSFVVTLAQVFPCRLFATATATDPNGNTSEFSACVPVTSLDTDGDGVCDGQELLAGTDRFSSASYFHITAIQREGNDERISWMVGGGRTNLLQATNGDPLGGFANNFVDLTPTVIVTGVGSSIITNRLDTGGATNKPSRYYRVRLVP